VVEPNLACPPTGAWDAWASADISASFTPGKNIVEIRNLADNVGPALDRITMSGANTNLAIDRSVVASSESPGYPASRAVDADLRTSWLPGGPPPQWLEVDLGDVCLVYRTQLVGPQKQVCRFKVEVKARAQDAYVEVVDRTNNITPGTSLEPTVDTFGLTVARYVRLTVTGVSGARTPEITEFRISAVTGRTGQAQTNTSSSTLQRP
jgi:hypothetical protein